MSNSNIEVIPMLQDFFDQALKHTGLILTRSWTLYDTWKFGAASAVYVKHNGHHLAITCRHVEANSDMWFIDTPAVEATMEGIQSISASQPTWPLAVWTAADVAFFQADPKRVSDNKREFYDFDRKVHLKQNDLKIGLTAIVTGMWGEESQYEQHDDKLLFAPFPYSAKGVIKEISEHQITARFEEHKVLVWDENDLHLAEKIDPQGQSRNLQGMSGSALWVPFEDNGILFAGLLKGPNTVMGDPDIVFTPAWTIAKRLAVLFPKA